MASRKDHVVHTETAKKGPQRGSLLSLPPKVALKDPEFPEIKDVKKRAFLVQYALTGNFEQAASAAKVTVRTVYNWRHDFREANGPFLVAVDQAQQMACDRMEAELYRRAMEGIEEPVWHGGEIVGTSRRFSDTLLMFMMKANMPQKYTDRMQHSGPDGGPIHATAIDVSALSHEELIEARRLAAKMKRPKELEK